jgi:hypothetical protein
MPSLLSNKPFLDRGSEYQFLHLFFSTPDTRSQRGAGRAAIDPNGAPLRFNFSRPLSFESYDRTRNFDLTIETRF